MTSSEPSPLCRSREANLKWLVAAIGSVAGLSRAAAVSRSRLTDVLEGSPCTPLMARRIELALGLVPLWLELSRPKIELLMRDTQAMQALRQFLPQDSKERRT